MLCPRFTAALVLLLIFSASCTARAAASVSPHSPNEVLIVYNAQSPVSTTIAHDYASKRGVTHLLAIHCIDSAVSTKDETISLADYTREIATPVSAFLAGHNEINFIVLTKGVPIRVNGAATGSRDETRPET